MGDKVKQLVKKQQNDGYKLRRMLKTGHDIKKQYFKDISQIMLNSFRYR